MTHEQAKAWRQASEEVSRRIPKNPTPEQRVIESLLNAADEIAGSDTLSAAHYRSDAVIFWNHSQPPELRVEVNA